MLDTDRLRPKLSPLDIWRIGASFMFLAFGGYFAVTFLLSLRHDPHRPWSQLLLGVLILLYGAYRVAAAWRTWRRLREQDQPVIASPTKQSRKEKP
jgi:TRAP-type C4-dicarboxylate transport system permease small subunit